MFTFEQIEKLISFYAYKISKVTKEDIQDVKQELWVVYLSCKDSCYSTSPSIYFNTRFSWFYKDKLKSFFNRNELDNIYANSIAKYSSSPGPVFCCLFHELKKRRLSKTVKLLIKYIENPEIIKTDGNKTPTIKDLMFNTGLSRVTIEDSIRTLKREIKSLLL